MADVQFAMDGLFYPAETVGSETRVFPREDLLPLFLVKSKRRSSLPHDSQGDLPLLDFNFSGCSIQDRIELIGTIFAEND